MDYSASSYHFRTRDLVTIGVLSALGGSLSTFIGYLGQLLNTAIGTPFGAGQFLSGLHVFWLILAAGLLRKSGAASLTGLLKGFVEFFVGSTHGIVIIIISLIQGLIIDGGLTLVRQRDSLPIYCIFGGLAAASNVIVFQLLYFSGVPVVFVLLLVLLALSSGVIFAGYFGKATIDLLISANVVRSIHSQVDTNGTIASSKFYQLNPYKVSAVVFLSVLAFGAGLYGVFIWRPFVNPLQCEVRGDVSQPFFFTYSMFAESEVTIEAELVGSVTYIPAANYTGIPLSIILAYAQPSSGATKVVVFASDGYSATFYLSAAINDHEIILTIDDGFRLIAKNYPGSFWVEKVTSLVVE
jgi:ABC-type thiamin/hydroxymethylpyrimidine transport system permease subunit